MSRVTVLLRPGGNALVLLALVLGLVLGATTVGMIWFLSGHSAARLPATPARTDAVTACATLARVFDDTMATGPMATGRVAIDTARGDLLAGAASLASVAQTEDARYAGLAAALHRASAATGPAAMAALARARAACAAL